MGEYHINGGGRVKGEYRLTGAKNAILPILAATVLNGGISVIYDCPDISDTYIAVDILRAIGCLVEIDKSTIIVDSSTANCSDVPDRLVKEMRSSIIFSGSLLGRFKRVRISHPGGCELGLRPIDFHLRAFRKMGVNIVEDDDYVVCETVNLTGTEILFDTVSVGATENTMLSAVLAEGITIIRNAAKEPEICDLQNFLNKMGADIFGAGTDTIVIKGVKELNDVKYTVMPDRIVAGTLLVAATITKGEILLDNVIHDHIAPITAQLLKAGCLIKMQDKKVHLRAPITINPISVQTEPHPGFPKCNKGVH